MFIKWRTYQRQEKGIKFDKYVHQPIVVESYRRTESRFKRELTGTPLEGILDEIFKSAEFKNRKKYPCHSVIYKLPSYPACMVIYFDDPHWMAQRDEWWRAVDMILAKLAEVRDDMPPAVVDKLTADLEAAVPRVE